MRNNFFQREGSISNSHIGNEFELKTLEIFNKKGLHLTRNISIPIGLKEKKEHKFDLGNMDKKVIVECKSHTWTKTGNVPSAKITTWNQAMFYFLLAPDRYRKIFVVLKDEHPKRGETLAEYYLRLKMHLIPENVEVWELDFDRDEIKQLK